MTELEIIKNRKFQFSLKQAVGTPVATLKAAMVLSDAKRLHELKDSNNDFSSILGATFMAANYLELTVPVHQENLLAELFESVPDCPILWDEYRKDLTPFMFLVSDQLITLFKSGISKETKSVLIASGIQFGPYLPSICAEHSDVEFYITADETFEARYLEKILPGCSTEFTHGNIFKDQKSEEAFKAKGTFGNVHILHANCYSPNFNGIMVDAVFCVPGFGGNRILLEAEQSEGNFVTRQFHTVALENMLRVLNPNGMLKIIQPLGVTFAADKGNKLLRKTIEENFCIRSVELLPVGMFRPSTSIKTLLFTITNNTPAEKVSLIRYIEETPKGKFSRKEVGELIQADTMDIPLSDICADERWHVEEFLDPEIKNNIQLSEKIDGYTPLENFADVFRGKSVSEKAEDGEYGYIQIGNIGEYEMKYDSLERVNGEPRKMKNYILEEDDILIPARGSAIRAAIFHTIDIPCIASANIIIIRVNKTVINPEFLKIVLDSPIGKYMIKNTQQGMPIININYKDFTKMVKIPLLPMDEQTSVVNKYKEELAVYRKAIASAEERWSNALQEINAF